MGSSTAVHEVNEERRSYDAVIFGRNKKRAEGESKVKKKDF